MNYDALNRYVLAAIAGFAVAFYVAVLWLGWADIRLHLRKRGAISKRTSSGRHARRCPKPKKAS